MTILLTPYLNLVCLALARLWWYLLATGFLTAFVAAGRMMRWAFSE